MVDYALSIHAEGVPSLLVLVTSTLGAQGMGVEERRNRQSQAAGADEAAGPVTVEEALTSWSSEDWAEAAYNLGQALAILREWDQEDRTGKARRFLESVSGEE